MDWRVKVLKLMVCFGSTPSYVIGCISNNLKGVTSVASVGVFWGSAQGALHVSHSPPPRWVDSQHPII